MSEIRTQITATGGEVTREKGGLLFRATEDTADACFAITYEFPEWKEDTFVFLPACTYDGNRMQKRYTESYPPSFLPSDLGEDPEPVIGDIPALAPDGGGKIEVTAGDLSVPCFGVYDRQSHGAVLVFTEAFCKGKPVGFAVESGRVTVQYPAMRKSVYRGFKTGNPSADSGFAALRGEQVFVRLKLVLFWADSITGVYHTFFQNRRCLLSDPPVPLAYTQSLLSAALRHINRDNFNGEYYAEMNHHFKCGWVGGPITALALFGIGGRTSRARAEKTLDFLAAHTSPQGFFYSYYSDGRRLFDGGNAPYMQDAMLVRKNADGLLAFFKILEKYKKKPAWERAAKAAADGFLRLYRRYGQFGHFVNIESGAMMVGGSMSGAPAISALCLASRVLGKNKYLDAAKEAGEKYYQKFASLGFTYGGPSDCLHAPDSESAYAMVEAMVTLYEVTEDDKWLAYAKNCLYYFSTWVMPYAFSFPKGSEFSRLGISTVGSVFANAQNKHAAPGVCTASAEAIFRLAMHSSDKSILALCVDIVSFLPQCVSTVRRPILSWDEPPKRLGSGWICERVNTSDWEGERCIGGVFRYSCWPESALLLTYAELIRNEHFRYYAKYFFKRG